MIGFATDETPALMSAALYLRDTLYRFALENDTEYGIDIKTQVTVDYKTKDHFDSNRPAVIKEIVAATDVEISEKLASLFPLTPGWITEKFGLY